jgi:hypothetical protein
MTESSVACAGNGVLLVRYARTYVRKSLTSTWTNNVLSTNICKMSKIYRQERCIIENLHIQTGKSSFTS